MRTISTNTQCFRYKYLSVYGPLGCAFLSLLMLLIAVFGANGIIQFLIFVLGGGIAAWGVTAVFENVNLELNDKDDTVVMMHTTLHATGWRTENHSLKLTGITYVWCETMGNDQRVVLGSDAKWMPLSNGFSNGSEPIELAARLCEWLLEKNYVVQQGKGRLPG